MTPAWRQPRPCPSFPVLARSWTIALLLLTALLPGPRVQGGAILREVYRGIGGAVVSDLTGDPSFPDSPSSSEFLTELFEAPTDFDDNYGQQLRGWIVPPADGTYRFWIASDDAGELWLSTDDSPANQTLIAQVPGWTASRAWDWYLEQQSIPITLVGGQRYFIRALMKEAEGGDNLAVRWADGNGLDEGPISATHLIPWGAVEGPPEFGEDPRSQTVLRGESVKFRVVLANFNPTLLQWRRNGEDLPGETGTTLTLTNVRAGDSGARFDCVAVNSLGTATSASAVLTVTWTGALWRDVYAGIAGESVESLTSHPSFPDRPTQSGLLTGLFEAPENTADAYGQRVHGWVVPPVTGQYQFWIASDDNSELWLGTDETTASQVMIARVPAWTPSRVWNSYAEQQSALIDLVAGQRYSIRALMKEGGGGDNLAVRWVRPDGQDEAPIPTRYFLPWGTGFSGPSLSEPPRDVSVVEGRRAEFVATLANTDATDFQWFINDAAQAGETGDRLVIDPARLSQDGAEIRVKLESQFGTASSPIARLHVTRDEVAPGIVRVVNLGDRLVQVGFDESLDPGSASDPAHYVLPGGPAIGSAALLPDRQTVMLTTDAPMTFGTTYRLQVSGVTDLAQTPNPVPAGTEVSFVVREWQPLAIGAPSVGETISAASGASYDVTARGRGLDGGSDEFGFFAQQRTGDFDEQVRLAGSTLPDAVAPVGLMAREDLSAESRFAAALLGSPLRGAWFAQRTATGASTENSGRYPHNGSASWLRLRRAGNEFTAYAGTDGRTWTLLGSGFLELPPTVYLGLTVASRDSAVAAVAQFRELGPTTSLETAPAPVDIEAAGPSSRFTGLTISEIQYLPAARPDGRNLEFVELFNASEVPENLAGMRLSGDIEFVFPNGAVLPGGGTLVVAANPADFEAVYGALGAMGPFTGSLPDTTGTVRLRNESNAILLEVNYRSTSPWPMAAGGTGHTLTLRRPSYGENDPRAWGISSRAGGTPGESDALPPRRALVFSEVLVLPGTGETPFVELFNASAQEVDAGGAVLASGADAYVLPAGSVVPAGGFRVLTATELGFPLPEVGGLLVLWNPDHSIAWDAVRLDVSERGVALGRLGNAGAVLRRLETSTPGAVNAGLRQESIVLNELMYNPLSGDNADEYVELHNRSDAAVLVGGWKLTDGIDYTIPKNTSIPAGGFLVIAKSKARLLANYSHLNAGNTLGNYGGSLRNSGERIALVKPGEASGTFVTVEEVSYSDGGRWGEAADGGGSSLERKDPRADATEPDNWGNSDESAKAPWTTLEFTGPLDLGHPEFSPSGLQIVLQDAGECLVDDVQVVRGAEANLVANGDFSRGTEGWEFLGNHSASGIAGGAGPDGSSALRIQATGRGDTGANRIATRFGEGLVPGDVVTLRARVRWLRGWPEVLFRLRGNWAELQGRMTVPANLGTPGLVNGARDLNLGPTLNDVAHHPAVPRSDEPVVVTARASDPDGVSGLTLRYHPDGESSDVEVALRDDGLEGDAVAGDGNFSARIPGQSAGRMIVYRVVATDGASPAATNVYPSATDALIRWGDPVWNGTMGTYRIWITQATFDAWRSGGGLDNTPRPFALAYGEGRVVQGSTLRDKGSPFHGGVGDFSLDFPSDDRVLGDSSIILASPGNQGNDDAKQREQIAFWIGRRLGLPYLNRRFVHVSLNGAPQYDIMEDAQEPGGRYVDAWFTNSGTGDLYKIEDWFEFFEEGGFRNTDATLEAFTSEGALKAARYRWAWRKRNVETSANDFSNLFALVTAANGPDATYVSDLTGIADMNNWMRAFVLQRIVGNWDSLGFGRGKNMYMFRRGTEPFRLVPWDIDFVLGSSSNPPEDALWGTFDPAINRMFDRPAFRRLLWAAYREAIEGPLRPEEYEVQLASRERALTANGVATAGTAGITDFIERRRAKIAADLAASDTAGFAITTHGGEDFIASGSPVELEGTAPFVVHHLRINGRDVIPEWTSESAWRVTLVLTQPVNPFTIEGVDVRGTPVPGATDSITISGAGEVPDSTSGLIVTEIMYNPLPGGAPGNDFEFLELYHAGSKRIDLTGVGFSAGINFRFPDGTRLDPGAFVVLARQEAGFLATYPGASFQGLYTGQLDNGGETLTLTNSAGGALFSFAYADKAPWPVTPDGTGPSLQRINLDPASSNGPTNWTASAATPGRALVAATGAVYAVNDVVTRPTDSAYKIAITSLLANDVGAGIRLSGFSATSALGGTLARSGPWLTYTPPANNLVDSFTYDITDGAGAVATGVVVIGVQPPPNAGVLVLGGEVTPEGFRVRTLGIPGFLYKVQASDSPAGPWTEIGAVIAGPQGDVEFIDPGAAGASHRFYQWIGP